MRTATATDEMGRSLIFTSLYSNVLVVSSTVQIFKLYLNRTRQLYGGIQRYLRNHNSHLHNSMGKFIDFVASHERKRKVRMICSSWAPTNNEKRKKRPFVSSSTISAPIGANVKITKSRVLKRMSKNDSVLHKVCWSLVSTT